MRISEQHLEHWREHGYAVVDRFLTPVELAAAQSEIARTFPSLEQYTYAPMLYSRGEYGGYMQQLPFLGDTLNFMAVHPEIVSFVERALGTPRIALSQSLVWAKYPGLDDFDMPLYVDYSLSTLLYPNTQEPPEEVAFILYYVDVDEQFGPTYVVPKQHSRDKLLVPYIRDKTQYPDLYRHEQPICVRAGSLLIYNMATFHRDSGIISKDRARFSHHFAYRSEDAPVGARYAAWFAQGLTAEMQRFIERASPRQRELLGFPSPSSTYWNEETLTGIAARYPNMDMMPYLEATGLPDKRKDQLRESFWQPRSGAAGLPGATNDMGQSAAQDGQQWPMDLASNYYREMADYYAQSSGIPADYWLAWLKGVAYNYCQIIADYYAQSSGVPADYWLTLLTTSYGLAQKQGEAQEGAA
jgi:hypothetical protein